MGKAPNNLFNKLARMEEKPEKVKVEVAADVSMDCQLY